MPRNVRIPKVDKNNPALRELVRKVRQEVEKRHGKDLTFEQRRDAAAAIMGETLWLDEEEDLQAEATDEDEIVVKDQHYRRLDQPSSAIYFGRWGGHLVAEPLYRELGLHNGPTLKPLEVRLGIVEHLTPDFARILGELSARCSSRVVEQILEAVGLASPSRAFIEDRLTKMADQVADQIEDLEAKARESQALPTAASITCGMDRMAIRMAEPADPETVQRPKREEPYQRTPPDPKEFHYRMAWVGSATLYDQEGVVLHTFRHALPAKCDPAEIARRVAADVAEVVKRNPTVDVACIQDGAPELDVLPQALRKVLPREVELKELTDIKHTMGYLEEVVDACEPEEKQQTTKAWYWSRLLRDDAAIERIVNKLRRQSKQLKTAAETQPKGQTQEQLEKLAKGQGALKAALSYIENRTEKMRYASRHDANLTIGSGETENTCWQMQDRVTRPAQAWVPKGSLRGILTLRGLVLSGLWRGAWRAFVESCRSPVEIAA